jgi:hypothetical protein
MNAPRPHVLDEGADDNDRKIEGGSRLIELGFGNYHARTAALRKKQLFDIKPDARGYFSGIPSKFFGNYLRDIGVKTGRELNFHSFRHTAADAFRRAGFVDEEFAPLLGQPQA